MKQVIKYKQIFFVLIVCYLGCHPHIRVNKDPFYESFYEKTRLIMTKEEKKIYKSLKADDSKREFTEEFWEIRDPSPLTEINENKIEFQRRILFANERFDKERTRRRDNQARSARGWQTAKGRIYVILGPPDKVNYGQGWEPMKKYLPRNSIYERWYYSFYNLSVGFDREQLKNELLSNSTRSTNRTDSTRPNTSTSSLTGSGGWNLSLDSKVLYAIEDAKQNMIPPQLRDNVQNSMRFKAKYKGNHIELSIPTEGVTFVDENGKLNTHLLVKINVYRNYEKVHEINEKRMLSFSEDEVIKLDKIVVEILYTPPKKGNYNYDVIVTDLKKQYLSKYRQFIKHKF